MLFVSRTQPSDQRVEAAPSLAEGTGARSGRVGLSEEDAAVQVDLSLSELVQVAQEVEDMIAVALGEGHRRVLILQVLSEGVPVPAFLRFVAAQRSRGGRGLLLLMLLVVVLVVMVVIGGCGGGGDGS